MPTPLVSSSCWSPSEIPPPVATAASGVAGAGPASGVGSWTVTPVSSRVAGPVAASGFAALASDATVGRRRDLHPSPFGRILPERSKRRGERGWVLPSALQLPDAHITQVDGPGRVRAG